MSLVYAAALLSASLVIARLLYIGCRRSTTPWWAAEGVMTVLILVVVGAMSLGLGFLLESLLAWERQVFGLEQAVVVAAIVAAGAVVWKLLGRALPASAGGAVIAMTQAGEGPDAPDQGGSPAAPELPTKAPRQAA